MSRLMSSALSQHHQGRSIVRTLGALAVATGLTLVVGCGQDLTEPTAVRPNVAAAKPLRVIGGSQNWNGRTVTFMSVQANSANQAVCLDIPWGQATVNQDVNYFPCHGGTAQQFTITAWDNPAGGSWAMIHPVSNSSMCFDMRGGTTWGGEQLQLFPCKAWNAVGAENQIFRLPPAMVWPAGGGLLLTTICAKRQPLMIPQPGQPVIRLTLEVPNPLAVSSIVRQNRLTGPTVANRQLWIINDLESGHAMQTADPAGTTWGTC